MRKADITERLRRCGCCDSCEAADEIERLRDERDHAVAALSEQIATLTRERDEARRGYCWAITAGEEHKALNIAHSRGWDCFKENTND